VELTKSTSVLWIPFRRNHIGVLFTVSCNRLFESPGCIDNLRIQCSVNLILRHFQRTSRRKDVTSDITQPQLTSLIGWSKHRPKETLRWTRHSYQSVTSTFPTYKLCYSYCLDTLIHTRTIYIKESRVSLKVNQEFV
jgi:hypothetical protein